MIIRSETPGDVEAIRIVEEVAFGRSDEARLIDDLRAAGDSVFSLVAVDDDKVVGHALFSRMKAPFPALALEGRSPCSLNIAERASAAG